MFSALGQQHWVLHLTHTSLVSAFDEICLSLLLKSPLNWTEMMKSWVKSLCAMFNLIYICFMCWNYWKWHSWILCLWTDGINEPEQPEKHIEKSYSLDVNWILCQYSAWQSFSAFSHLYMKHSTQQGPGRF